MAILQPYKDSNHFESIVDEKIKELEDYYDVVLDFDFQLKEAIKIFDEILIEKSTEKVYEISVLLKFFSGFSANLADIKKVLTKNLWRIEPYFEQFNNYREEDYLFAKADLEDEINRYEKILNKQLGKGMNFLKEMGVTFSF